MYKCIICVLEFLLLAGCSLIQPDAEIIDLGEPTEAIQFIHDNIKYVADDPGKDYWQLPSETMSRGAGDCEDAAMLFISALRARGYDSRAVLVVTSLASADPINSDGSDFGHMLTEYDNKWISPQWAIFAIMPKLFTPARQYYTFDELIEQAQLYHRIR